MKMYMYNRDQEDEIVHYLAEQEELQKRDLGHLTGTEVEIDSIHPLDSDLCLFVQQ